MFGCAYEHKVNEVTQFVGVSKRTVQHVFKQWCNLQSTENWLHKCGRKTMLASRGCCYVASLVTASLFQTMQQLLQEVNESPLQPISKRAL